MCRAALDRDRAAEVALAREGLGRRSQLEARYLRDDPAALLALPLRSALRLELVEVVAICSRMPATRPRGLADRLRRLLGGEDRDVGEGLRTAVVVEVGVCDEEALELTCSRAEVAAGGGREAAVDDEGRRRSPRSRPPRPSRSRPRPTRPARPARSGSGRRSRVQRRPERPDVLLERVRAVLGDQHRARADDDAVGELGGGSLRARASRSRSRHRAARR